MTTDRMSGLRVFWDRVSARRLAITWLVLISTTLVGIVAWLLPPWYRAQASLLPPSEDEGSVGFATLLKGVGVPGIRVPTQASPADVYIAVLASRRINEEIVRRFELQRLYKRHFLIDTVRELRRHTSFILTDAGTIQIEVEDRDPQRAADMANAYIQLLDRFNREVRMTKGRRARLFVEQRLGETRDSLRLTEERLAEYESTHKAVALTPEMSSAVEVSSRHIADRSALQVRLGVIRGYTRGVTDEEVQILQQLRQLDRQLMALPATGLDLARLIRDVRTLEQLYILLLGQYEEARILEARDVATLDQLDVATRPERKSRPKRTLMVASTLLFSLMAGVTYALLLPVAVMAGPTSARRTAE